MSLNQTQFFFEQFSDTDLLTNSTGEHVFLSPEDFTVFQENPEKLSDKTKLLLKSRFFLYEEDNESEVKSIYDIYDIRTGKQSFVSVYGSVCLAVYEERLF